mmetsp:Transcript_38968/g.123988  ORF Transcript_38968/g.123988 Transcript_38968/m.123988 type:complete len:110 (+) Transcript_38968:569-898(+)
MPCWCAAGRSPAPLLASPIHARAPPKQSPIRRRNKYGLVGTFCECCECCRCCSNCTGCRTKEEFDDLCVSFWCRPCAVCQDARMLVANNITAPGMDQHMLAPGAQQFAY